MKRVRHFLIPLAFYAFTFRPVVPINIEVEDHRKTILVVDVDSVLAEVITMLLDDANLNVVAATESSEGLRLAHELSPALVLCDWSMPRLAGSEVLQLLRADPATAHVPFVLMSGFPPPDFDTLPADGFLAKPFDAQELRSVVRTFAAAGAAA